MTASAALGMGRLMSFAATSSPVSLSLTSHVSPSPPRPSSLITSCVVARPKSGCPEPDFLPPPLSLLALLDDAWRLSAPPPPAPPLSSYFDGLELAHPMAAAAVNAATERQATRSAPRSDTRNGAPQQQREQRLKALEAATLAAGNLSSARAAGTTSSSSPPATATAAVAPASVDAEAQLWRRQGWLPRVACERALMARPAVSQFALVYARPMRPARARRAMSTA
mmetsp:Transcript_26414/g.78442  ORF Transcript_26414/g.78442 Transcript_26414/m.78442 type:complete len:225 (-) Transcript_26414:106-780(-)